METVGRSLFGLSIATLLFGCAGGPKTGNNLEYSQIEIASVRTPFLAGVLGVFLTNSPAFSAKVTVETSFGTDSGHPRATSGTLLGSGNNFIFAPEKAGSPAKGGSMGFIWNGRETKGFVLNEALQAYAEFKPMAKVTNIIAKPELAPATSEKVNGRVCRVIPGRAFLSDGSSADFTVWKAEELDLKGLPFRIKSISGNTQVTVNLSDVRFEAIDPELFSPPDGFAQYPTPQAMIDELMRRQNRTGTKGSPRDFDDSTSWTPHERAKRY